MAINEQNPIAYILTDLLLSKKHTLKHVEIIFGCHWGRFCNILLLLCLGSPDHAGKCPHNYRVTHHTVADMYPDQETWSPFPGKHLLYYITVLWQIPFLFLFFSKHLSYFIVVLWPPFVFYCCSLTTTFCILFLFFFKHLLYFIAVFWQNLTLLLFLGKNLSWFAVESMYVSNYNRMCLLIGTLLHNHAFHYLGLNAGDEYNGKLEFQLLKT